MQPTIIREENGSLTISINLHLQGTMLEQEEQIRQAVNSVGRTATGCALQSFDTNGTPIELNGVRHTSKKPQKKSS